MHLLICVDNFCFLMKNVNIILNSAKKIMQNIISYEYYSDTVKCTAVRVRRNTIE